MRPGGAPERGPRDHGVPGGGRARLRPPGRRRLARRHARRPHHPAVALLGAARPGRPVAAPRADHRGLLVAQRLRGPGGRAGGLRRVGPGVGLRRRRALPRPRPPGPRHADVRARGAVAVARGLRRGRGRGRDRPPGQRRRPGAPQRGLRLPRPGARAAQPHHPGRHHRRSRRARRRPGDRRAHLRRRAVGRGRRAGVGRLRVAGRAAAKRHRPRARPAGGGEPDRPRRRGDELGPDRPAAGGDGPLRGRARRRSWAR